MAIATSNRRSPEELSRLGGDILHGKVEPLLNAQDNGKFVAIDVDGGAYEVHEDDYTAVTRLKARKPGAEIWLGCVGQMATCRMGRGR